MNTVKVTVLHKAENAQGEHFSTLCVLTTRESLPALSDETLRGVLNYAKDTDSENGLSHPNYLSGLLFEFDENGDKHQLLVRDGWKKANKVFNATHWGFEEVEPHCNWRESIDW